MGTSAESERRLTCNYVGYPASDIFSMTHHVECVAILESAAKGA